MRHIIKAFMDNLDIKKMPKNAKKICCEKCNFICFKKSNYEKHLSTPKHSKIILEDNKNEKIFICKCGKIYKYLSGLSKHKKTCNLKESNTEKLLTESNIIMLLIKENQEFKKIMIEQNQKNQELMIEQNQKNQELIMELASKTTTINNNNCNNKFNMNIFLNEQCKDAMNIMDFVSSLKISFDDLENVGKCWRSWIC
jgi:predicted lactoylglutathione lyase